MNSGSSQEIQMVITFLSDVRFRLIIYRDNQNWTRKVSENSNDVNFWLGYMIEAHDISRRLKLNNGSSRTIKMVINFHSDVNFRRVIYWDPLNWTRKLLENSNGHNFWLGCMIEANDISGQLKSNSGSCLVIQMVITFDSDIRFSHIIVITFHSEVRFRRIIYRDALNWTTEALEKFKWS